MCTIGKVSFDEACVMSCDNSSDPAGCDIDCCSNADKLDVYKFGATTTAGANGIGKIIMVGKSVCSPALEDKKAATGVVDMPCVVVVD